MPNVNIDVEIEVWCECGEGLCRQTSGGNGCVTVEPCEKCLEAAKSEGHEEGQAEGYDEGYAEAEKDLAA